ncbi:MAG: hypothetical protein KAU31_16100 [Spirochaetaceae bacterium]|nr:hypothetical protein [Spirochaetaceae bacterium]
MMDEARRTPNMDYVRLAEQKTAWLEESEPILVRRRGAVCATVELCSGLVPRQSQVKHWAFNDPVCREGIGRREVEMH